MARMTNAERKKIEAEENQKKWNAAIVDWNAMFIKLLYLYPKTANFSVEANETHTRFTFTADNGRGDYVRTYDIPVAQVPEIINWLELYEMEDAFQAIANYEDSVKEEIRKSNVIAAARAKLTAEERQLLGLR